MTMPTFPSRNEILAELRGAGFRANARLGQCFLFDPQLLEAFLDDAAVGTGEVVLEVGVGAGTLTRRLLARGCHVVGVEIDPVLVHYLERHLVHPAFELVAGDALEGKNQLSPRLTERLGGERFRLIANLPYAVATPVLAGLIETFPTSGARGEEVGFLGAAALVQAELAQRWFAAPGCADFGAISVLLSQLGSGRVTRAVRRDLFTPPPRVDSSFVVWDRNPEAATEVLEALPELRSWFQQRRKMLRAHVGSVLPEGDPWWKGVTFQCTQRPGELSPTDLVTLALEVRRRRGRSAGHGGH